jgi:hypothetical protein
MVRKAEPGLESGINGFQAENIGGIRSGETTMGFGLSPKLKDWYEDWKATDMLDHPETWRRVRDSAKEDPDNA